MLLDPIYVQQVNRYVYSYNVACDWDGCNEKFLSGHKRPPHYCPTHQKANKQRRVNEGHQRECMGIEVAGTEYDTRRSGSVRVSIDDIADSMPRCPVCKKPISALQDCECP